MAAILLCASLTAWGESAPENTTLSPVEIAVLAVHASTTGTEEKHFDSGLDSVRSLLSDLHYDTFKRIASQKQRVPFTEEGSFKINSDYTLLVSPLVQESDGRIRVRARVEVESKEKPGKKVNALVTTNRVVPGDRLMFRGLPAERGELILLLTVGTKASASE